MQMYMSVIVKFSTLVYVMIHCKMALLESIESMVIRVHNADCGCNYHFVRTFFSYQHESLPHAINVCNDLLSQLQAAVIGLCEAS